MPLYSGMFKWINHLIGRQEQRAITPTTPGVSAILDTPTRTGIAVNEQTALGVSAVWCAIKVISESIGSLPLVTYCKTADGGRERAEDHPLYPILHDSPNPELTRPVFFETFMSHALLWGTGYAEIERDNAGNPIGLWAIHPQHVQVMRNTVTGGLVYRVYLPQTNLTDPKLSNRVVYLPQEDVIAVPGIGYDGSAGYSLLNIARENLAYSVACDRFGQSFFGNSARLGGVLETPNKLSDDGRNNLKASWQQIHGGVDNTGKTGVLEEGLTYKPFTFTNEAGLYQDTRQFQITEVSRLFNISPVKLHELGRATWANLAVLNTDFYITTLRPWLEKIECEIERKLFGIGSEYYVEFLADSILRADTATRYAAYRIANPTAIWLTDAEIRQFENLPPLPEVAEDDTSDEPSDDDVEPNGDQGDEDQDKGEDGNPTVSK